MNDLRPSSALKIRLLLLALLGLNFSLVQAQSVVLQGRITDAQTGEGLSYANIVVQGTEVGTLSGTDGSFQLEAPSARPVLVVSRLGYKKQVIPVKARGKNLRMDIALETSDVTLGNVIISDGLQRVLADKTLHLYDYEFFEDQLIVILYDRSRHRSQLALVNAQDSITQVIDGIETPGKLAKDCLGNVYAIGKKHACQLFLQDGKLAMYQGSIAAFERVVAPCIGQLDEYYYYKFGQGNDQLMQFVAYNAESKTQAPLYQIKDKEKIHQMLDPLGPYVQFASTEAQLLSIPASYWEKVNKIDHEYQFNRLAFFYPVSAPLHILNDQVHLFDHTNGVLHKLDKSGELQAEIPISYHKLPKFQRSIIVDPLRDEAYALYEKHGVQTLSEIDLETGELKGSYKLPRQFPVKVQVRDGVAFFMYKELHYDTTNRLYRLRLKD